MDEHRIILVDPDAASREALAQRLRAQGYAVELAPDAAVGADMALRAPPSALIADLWMPSISGVQLCRLLGSEPATAEVPVILRGNDDDPRSRFWAERAGASAYVRRGRIGELVRAVAKAVKADQGGDGFFMQLSGGSMDIRDRIAQHLDAALFESVIASEVRALATCGSLDRLLDLFSQFFAQVHSYRWLAVHTRSPERFAVHGHPRLIAAAEQAARQALGVAASVPALLIEDEDAQEQAQGPAIVQQPVPFGNAQVGSVAMAPAAATEREGRALLALVARELGGAIRMASLVEESQRLASTDSLTGLMNRRAFSSATNAELSRSHRHCYPLSLLLLDVDHFKSINDRYGHNTGDRVLAAVGALLRQSLRVSDLAGRWGGEEFVVALPSTSLEGGVVVAERLREALAGLVIKDDLGQPFPVTASFGVASLAAGLNLEGLVERADQAMYAAKMGGRNRVEAAGDASSRRLSARAPQPAAHRAADGAEARGERAASALAHAAAGAPNQRRRAGSRPWSR